MAAAYPRERPGQPIPLRGDVASATLGGYRLDIGSSTVGAEAFAQLRDAVERAMTAEAWATRLPSPASSGGLSAAT